MIYDPFQTNFFCMVWDKSWYFFFIYGYPVVSAPCFEKLSFFGTFVGNQLTIYVWLCPLTPYSIDLYVLIQYYTVFFFLPYCFDCHSFIVFTVGLNIG